MKSMKPFSPVNKTELKEQLQINLLQVFEDVNILDVRDPRTLCNEYGHINDNVRDMVLDHMCNVIIQTINKA